MKVLVVGCGSIGERHIKNLRSLSVRRLIGCDINRSRLSLIKQKYHIEVYQNLKKALAQKVDAVLVCTPPVSHISIALESVNYGAHVFIEKPISHTLQGIDGLIKRAKRKGLFILVGYNLRFHPGIRLLKRLIDEGEIGQILSARAEVGQFLPDWRPWQDYRQSYTAKKAMGGGIILDASHEIDYLCWLLGEVKSVFCMADKLSDLKVETEDTAEIIMKFRNNIIVETHLDFVQREYARSCKIIGEQGTIIWDYPEKFVKVYHAKTKRWKLYRIRVKPNEMYLQEMRHLIRCLKGKEKPLIDGQAGKRVLKIALAAKRSAQTGKMVQV